jgi:4,5-DOPA dioxygenase extradiol
LLAFPKNSGRSDAFIDHAGPSGPLASFLADFGPTLLAKYQPKGIVVFSAHWESGDERLGMSGM